MIKCLKEFEIGFNGNFKISVLTKEEFNNRSKNRKYAIKRFVYRPDFLDPDGYLFPFRKWIPSFTSYYEEMTNKLKSTGGTNRAKILLGIVE